MANTTNISIKNLSINSINTTIHIFSLKGHFVVASAFKWVQ